MLVDVENRDWRGRLEEAHDEGYVFLDLLTAVDRRRWDPRTGESLASDDAASWEFIAHVVRPVDGARLWIRALHAQAELDSVVDLFPAAAWHEREVSEMFGVRIVDGSGRPSRPLLVSGDIHPLRKDTALPARLAKEWPGAVEAGSSRRRVRTPGIPAMWRVSDDSGAKEHDERG